MYYPEGMKAHNNRYDEQAHIYGIEEISTHGSHLRHLRMSEIIIVQSTIM